MHQNRADIAGKDTPLHNYCAIIQGLRTIPTTEAHTLLKSSFIRRLSANEEIVFQTKDFSAASQLLIQAGAAPLTPAELSYGSTRIRLEALEEGEWKRAGLPPAPEAGA